MGGTVPKARRPPMGRPSKRLFAFRKKVDQRSVVFGTNFKHLGPNLLGCSLDFLHDLADAGASGFVATLGLVDVFINRFHKTSKIVVGLHSGSPFEGRQGPFHATLCRIAEGFAGKKRSFWPTTGFFSLYGEIRSALVDI